RALRRGGLVARASQARPALRAASLSVLQSRARLRPSAQDPRGHQGTRAGGGHRARLRRGSPRAPSAARPPELTSLPLPFYDNPLLFGRAGTPGLLALDAAHRTGHVYARADGRLSVSAQPLRPFLLLADRDLLRGFRGGADIVPLEGEGAYQFLAECPSWAHALRLRDHCQGLSGIAAGAPHAPYRFFSDPTHQHL